MLGGRKVAIGRPRVRAGNQEVTLPTFQAMADVNPLNRHCQQLFVVSPSRCLALEPILSQAWSLRPAATITIKHTKVVHCIAGTILRGKTEPMQSLRVVAMHADSATVGNTK